MSNGKKITPTAKKRIIFAAVFVLLTAAEFYIGLYVRDDFIRPYFGDVLIVIVLYSFIRMFIPERFTLLAVSVFSFAVLVELSQLIPLVDLLGIKNRFVRTLMGSSFAFGDIISYAVGIIPCAVYDLTLYRKKRNGEKKQ